jgi:hypothetical protein
MIRRTRSERRSGPPNSWFGSGAAFRQAGPSRYPFRLANAQFLELSHDLLPTPSRSGKAVLTTDGLDRLLSKARLTNRPAAADESA